MPYQFAPLWTDLLVYLLVAVTAVFAAYAARHEHLRAPWRHVLRRPLAMSAVVVLAAYGAIGLLDSVHLRERLADTNASELRYSSDVKSLLDLLLAPLRTRTERTYSAPLAATAYSMETAEKNDGTTVREYPRLTHGGSHLGDLSHHAADVWRRIVRATLLAVAVWTVAAACLLAWLRERDETWRQALGRLARGETEYPWRSILSTAGILLWVVVSCAYLSKYYHVLGTDQVGNDVLFKSLKSIRTGLLIGTLTTLVMLPFALLLGIMAGFFRGLIDDIIQYLYTTLSSIPDVLLIAAAVLSLHVYMGNHPETFDNVTQRADARLLFLCIILGVTSWTGLCRLLRGETLKLRETDYVQAARALGVSSFRIMTRHLLPNVMHLVLIAVVLDFSGLVLAEAVLSYVGVGVDPTMDSWGNMINGARLEMAREPMVWWSLASAFVFMFLLVLAANLFADAVRDAFDPRLRK
jgi:peptide/nickel transport system permease protein